MNHSTNIYLVGPMGVGKSTIGRRLAKLSRRDFVDSDKVIEDRTGVDIELIFEIEGEEGFRKREAKILQELTIRKGIVLATGGGAVLNERNRRLLIASGKVVYLSASSGVLYERTRKDRRRPLLQTGNRRQRIEEMLAERHDVYASMADCIVNTDRCSVNAAVKKVCKSLDITCEN